MGTNMCSVTMTNSDDMEVKITFWEDKVEMIERFSMSISYIIYIYIYTYIGMCIYVMKFT